MPTRLSVATISLLIFGTILAIYVATENDEQSTTPSTQNNQANTLNDHNTSTVSLPVLANALQDSKTSTPKPPKNKVDEPSPKDYRDELQHSRLDIFTDSITKGDTRTPPIIRQAPEEQPSQEELEDPDKYHSFQTKQRQKVLISYLKAAQPKLDYLRKAIAEGERLGISEEQLREGKTKIRKIEEMVEQVKANNPELDISTGPEL